MAARRGKSQARRNASNGLPGWAWLVIGVLVTLLVVLAAPRLLKSGAGGDGFLRIGPKPNPDAQPAASASEGDAVAPDVATDTPTTASKTVGDKPKPTQYDFYTLLPGEEVAMSDAELAASARAEAAAQAAAAAKANASTASTATTADGLPAPIAENAAATATSATASTATASPSATTIASTPATPATKTTGDAHYILQAGAFGGSGDAEAVKAKIAMLGLNARVEAAEIGGKTVYRVRMGPYGTASELSDAKGKLASGGLPAMAVKTN